MMLRSLVDEVVRRRLWPIPLLALLVAIAAPLLFMKSAPTNASTAPPPPAPPGALPIKAKQLMSPHDAPKVIVKPGRKKQDPFAPPASSAQSASATSASTTAEVADPSQSVPVSVDGSSGATVSPTSTSTQTTEPSTTSSSTSSSSTTPATSSTTSTSSTKSKSSTAKKQSTKPKVTTPKTTTSLSHKTVTYVDVRFGKRMGTMLRYRVPRLQTFQAGGRVAAMFVGYAANRNAAVFAIAPSTAVAGVKCRKVKGVCRFIDVPAGAHARLRLVGEKGVPVSRRLDVSIRHLRVAIAGTKTSARMTSLSAAKCLFTKLVTLPTTAPSISTDACA